MNPKIKRPREIKSCQKCFQGKRKCDKVKPSCGRCKKLEVACFYAPSTLHSVYTPRSNSPSTANVSSYLELEPTGDPDHSIKGFKLILDPSGVQSIYFPVALFPFNDTASRRCLALSRSPDINDKKVVFNFSTWTSQVLNLDHIKAKIPRKPTCDMLVSHFFSSIFPLVPILDKESFVVNYNAFWADVFQYFDLNGLVLIHAVIFCASCSLQINEHFLELVSDTDYESIMLDSFNCIENINHLLNIHTTPSIPSLSALTLIYYVSSLNCYGLAARVSLLLRYSHIAGLHKRISKTSGTTLKELLYEYIVLLDSLVSYYYGLSPQVSEYQDCYVENVHSSPIAYSLIKFKCGKLWSQIIRELDGSNLLHKECLARLQNSFITTQNEVNYLNEIILLDNKSTFLNLWLATEGRLCLRRAALLLSFSLRYSQTGCVDETSDRDLIVESLLLINESFMKVRLALENQIDCLWFVRTSYPFESLYIVLKDLKENPNDSINFAGMNPANHYTKCPTLDYVKGDLRKALLPLTFEVLCKIQVIWPLSFRKAFQRIHQTYEDCTKVF